jgi:Flp pilus assembly CpaF family ATPase
MEVRLCSFRDQAVAGMIENLLRSRGLHPIPTNTSGYVFVAGANQWYDIKIPEEEEKIAREIITEAGHGNALSKR